MHFFCWKFSRYFEFVSAKCENIKVRCTLCAGDKVLSSFKSRVKQRAVSKATASTSAGGPPPPKQQKLHLGAKQVNGRELKKLVGWYVVEEMLYLNTDDSPSLSAIIEKIPSTINAVLPHRTSFCSYSEKSEGCAECK